MYGFRKSKKGFTLIELMVVVAIIGILALLGLRVYIGQMNKSKNSIVIANASTVHTLIQGDLLDHNYTSATSTDEPGKPAASVIINIGGLASEGGAAEAAAHYLANMRNPFDSVGVIALVGTISAGGNEGEVIVEYISPNYFQIQGTGANGLPTGEILRAIQ